MTAIPCAAPLALAELVDYAAGDLDGAGEARVEEHLFSCASCGGRLEAVQRLGERIAGLARRGVVPAVVTRALVERMAGEGLRVRRYEIAPGQTVPCTAAPDDDLLAIALAGELAQADDVELAIDVQDLDSGARTARHMTAAPVDRRGGGMVLIFPAERVRAYPRSVWTMRVRGRRGGEADAAELGTFALDHTPWERLGAR